VSVVAVSVPFGNMIGRHSGIIFDRSHEKSFMRKILFMPDFPGDVFWEQSEKGGPVAPEDLNLSSETCSLVWEFYKRWSEIDNDSKNDGIRKIDYGLLDVHGIKLWKQLRTELSGQCEVFFYSHRFNESFEDPQELEELLTSGI
jgi:hypothetical protein